KDPGFAGGGIEESTDGGQTWHEINVGTAGHNGPGTGYHALAFDHNDHPVAGDDEGVWRRDSNDRKTPGVARADFTADLQSSQIESVAPEHAGPNIAYGGGGNLNNGTEKYRGTSGWIPVAGTPGWIFPAATGGITRVDPTNPNRVYQEGTFNSLEVSDDAGT